MSDGFRVSRSNKVSKGNDAEGNITATSVDLVEQRSVVRVSVQVISTLAKIVDKINQLASRTETSLDSLAGRVGGVREGDSLADVVKFKRHALLGPVDFIRVWVDIAVSILLDAVKQSVKGKQFCESRFGEEVAILLLVFGNDGDEACRLICLEELLALSQVLD